MVQDPAVPVVLVLAAGRGSRFGAGDAGRGHKLEQPFGDSTVLGSTLAQVRLSGLPLLVVTVQALRAAVPGWVAEDDIVLLPAVGDPKSPQPLGMGYSIATGVTHRPHARGWLVLPSDMPLVQPDTLLAVAQALPHHLVVYAQHRGRRGHPVGFGAEMYSELARLAGDDGARRLLARFPSQGVEVPDPGVLLDIDTGDDLTALRQARAAHRGQQADVAATEDLRQR